MRITANQLKKIIKEEMRRVLQEAPDEAKLEKLEGDIRKYMIQASDILESIQGPLSRVMNQYAAAWKEFAGENPDDVTKERVKLAQKTARTLNVQDLIDRTTSIMDDVDAYRSELERGSGRNQ